MKTDVRTVETVSSFLPGASLALGFFDGVHLGHRKLLDRVREDPLPGVLTFTEDMKGTLKKTKPVLILTEEEKERQLEREGMKVDDVLVFDEALRNLSVEAFREVLVSFSPRKIVVGEDFTFARGGLGKAKDLLVLKERGIDVEVVPLLYRNGAKVASREIRALLEKGKLAEANAALGYPFYLYGEVVHGVKNGTGLGFPTANQILPPDKVSLPYGAYKTETLLDGKVYPSMTSIGVHPTIDEIQQPIVETNLIGYQGNLYGKKIEVRFLSFLAPEMKFETLDELKEALIRYREMSK